MKSSLYWNRISILFSQEEKKYRQSSWNPIRERIAPNLSEKNGAEDNFRLVQMISLYNFLL